jgi:nucleoid DNA-binding protein
MNKTELIDAMAKETGLSKKDTEAALKAFIDVVSKQLKKKDKVYYKLQALYHLFVGTEPVLQF